MMAMECSRYATPTLPTPLVVRDAANKFPTTKRKRLLPLLVAGILTIFTTLAVADVRLADRVQIESLISRYLYAMDWRDAQAFANTFVEDGVISWTEGSLEGRPAMRTYMADMVKKETEAKKAGEITEQNLPSLHHVVSNLVIAFDESNSETETAKAWSYWTTVDNYTNREIPRILSFGHYEDELVKINGEWFFTYRHVYNETILKRVSGPFSPIHEFELLQRQ